MNFYLLTQLTNFIGDVSKAAVYSTLNAVWTIVFGLIRSEYELWIVFYMIAIAVGYSLINYDKKVAADKARRAKVKIRFIQRIENEDINTNGRQTLTI